jgi:gamma-glutamyltranspeptidase / glutathione hydrolase
MSARGICAAGHEVTAEAGARVLREGGNAVDAALAAMLVSWVAEPLLTGPGAGGYLLVAGAGVEPTLLDFFVAAPGAGAEPGRARGDLVAIDVSFGDAVQVFHGGAAACGTYGTPAGIVAAGERWGSVPLEQLAAPAARMAREGVPLSAQQAYVFEILSGILTLTPESAAIFAPHGPLREGELFVCPELGDTIERLGRDGARPFYEGDIAAAIVDWLAERGGLVTKADLSAYEVVDREPVCASYRGREVLTNPPPSAGGILVARALAMLDGAPSPPSIVQVVEVMESTQNERTPEFLAGLGDPRFVAEFLARPVSTLGSTTHIAALDRDGWACSVTCSNGSASGVVVPGTGVHLNNMLGEQDLNPLGFHRHAPGRRMPSMMSPTIVLRDGAAQLAVGSAGSNRIRSAVLQTIIRSIDDGLEAQAAIDAPRVHFEDGMVYSEPGVDVAALESAGRLVSPFRDRNLFFGGAQAAALDAAGRFSGGGDPRRGGAAIVVQAA